MRIGIDARYLDENYSGIAIYSENLLTHLARVDEKNRYVVFVHRNFQRRLRLGDNFKVIRCGERPMSLRTAFRFGRRVARLRCDFLHSLSPVAPLFAAPRVILTIHDLQPFHIGEDAFRQLPLSNRLTSLVHRAMFPHFIRSATWLITVSQATKDRLIELFPDPNIQGKSLSIHSGVEEEYFSPPEATVTQLALRKLDPPAQYMLYVGSAAPNKNLPLMLRAFARCLAQSPAVFEHLHFLLILGSERNVSTVKRLARALGLQDRVRILGATTDEEKRVLYSRAMLLFSVTRGEGFGFPILEAQAAGVPVLAGDDAAVPEIVAESAMLVPPGDEEAVAQALTRLVSDRELRQVLEEAGRANARRFSWDETARKVLEVYKLLM